jgi:polar amino acid transport system permease protein
VRARHLALARARRRHGAEGTGIALPPQVRAVVALLKSSALAYMVGVVQVSLLSTRVRSTTFQPLPCSPATALIDLVLTALATRIPAVPERR